MPLHLKSFTIPAGGSLYKPNQDKTITEISNRFNFHSAYPFYILNYFNNNAFKIQFDKITLFYGNNGSGKSTLLNLIAEKIKAKRYTQFNKTSCFADFCKLCHEEESNGCPDKRIIASDEIFEKMLTLRDANTYKMQRQDQIFDEQQKAKYDPDSRVKEIKFDDMESIKKFENYYTMRRLSFSKWVKLNVGSDIVLHSNGETAYDYFVNIVDRNGLYLLDEPENSLSAELQGYLAEFLGQMAEKANCQFIIATHSPFFLSIPNAKLYNLDNKEIVEDKWTNLPTVKAYYELFKKRENEFKRQ